MQRVSRFAGISFAIAIVAGVGCWRPAARDTAVPKGARLVAAVPAGGLAENGNSCGSSEALVVRNTTGYPADVYATQGGSLTSRTNSERIVTVQGGHVDTIPYVSPTHHFLTLMIQNRSLPSGAGASVIGGVTAWCIPRP